MLDDQDASRSTDGAAEPVEMERLNRCYWAAWITNCISADNYVVGSSLGIRRIKTPLPLAEAAPVDISRRARATLADVEDLTTDAVGAHQSRQVNLVLESIRAIFRWWASRTSIWLDLKLTSATGVKSVTISRTEKAWP